MVPGEGVPGRRAAGGASLPWSLQELPGPLLDFPLGEHSLEAAAGAVGRDL